MRPRVGGRSKVEGSARSGWVACSEPTRGEVEKEEEVEIEKLQVVFCQCPPYWQTILVV